ncbi:M56 family metallopeptidase [Paenibacillus alvei]|uniref:M56 family metallopeptidase n=2 Tax=Paenibacillus alvei TaxID=44250 RepID=UPI00227E1824|nr:M56 family metallopeptidase [Paenibacillus alvei]
MSHSIHPTLLSVFGWVIRGSFMASILVVLVLILQFLLKNKLEARWKYLLWIPVAIRLLLPWAPESSFSLYNIVSLEAIVPGIHQQTQDPSAWREYWIDAGRNNEAEVHGKQSFNSEKNGPIWETIVSNPPHESGTVQESRFGWNRIKQMNFVDVLMLIWLAGVLLFAAKTVFDQLRLKQALRAGHPIETPYLLASFYETKQLLGVTRKVQFVASERISGPAVVGFIKPAIVISPSLLITLKKEQLQYILAHEFAHIRRRDVAVNWVMFITLIFHWFNPLLWLAVHKAREDQEMACDACVLDRMSPQQNNAYGQTIIHVLEHFSGNRPQPGLAGMSATHKQMKRRLTMIKQFNKKSYHLSILGLATILTLGSVTLVNAKESKAESVPQTASVQSEQGSNAAVNHEPDIIYPAGVINREDRELYKKEMEKAIKKAEDAAKAIPADEREFIASERKRVRELPKESGDLYIMYHKYKNLNNGLEFEPFGKKFAFSTYEDYVKKASTLNGPILQQPSNLPEGYTFSKAVIENPIANIKSEIEKKFFDELRAEGKKSGKPVYTKKLDWKEPGRIRLEYTNGKDTLIFNQYTADEEFSKLKGFSYETPPTTGQPVNRYVFWYGTGKYYYSITTHSDMTKEQMTDILKAVVKK